MPERPDARAEVKRAMQATPGCLPLDRLGEEHSAAERQHILACAHCQAELALWREFEASPPDARDDDAVQWIVAEVKRRRHVPRIEPRRIAWGGWLDARGLMAVAATLILAVAVGYLAWDRAPAVRDVGNVEPQAYRTAQVLAIAPVGDVDTRPREFQWKPVQGAVSYDLAIFEVDRTVVWRASSAETRVAPPGLVVSRFVPGKPFLWEVTARDRSNAAIANSGTQRFRVAPSRGD